MAEQTPDPFRQEEWAVRRAERRARERLRLRRQRQFALGALVLAAAGIAVLLVGLGGGGGLPGRTTPAVHGPRQIGRVRNGAPQPDWEPHKGSVPILEYHVLGRPHTEVAYPKLYVGRAEFRKQMDWLEAQGYEAVTLETVEDAWFGHGALPRRPIVISFDDGYRPQYTFALPTLAKHGWPGVLNLKAEGSDLYHSNVEAMIAAGWELAAHTIHHSDLTTLEGAALEEEVAGSRRILRREYGVPVADFCYPAGRFDPAVVHAVEAAGYTGATTEVAGFATRGRPYELDRIEVLGEWGVPGLAAAMRSAAARA